MKPLFKVLLAVLVVLVVSAIGGYFYVRKQFQPPVNQLTVTQLPATSSFVWDADTTARPAIPHSAMLVPVTLPGCARTCYLQFDTGAPYSVLYDNPLAALRVQYPATSTTLLPQADGVHNFRYTIGKAQAQARTIRVLHGGATQLPADSTAPFVIGTLGSDVLAEQVLVIDYANRQFNLYAAVPDSLARRATYVPMSFDSRRVMLNMGLQGESKQMLFDSGSSAFALITNQSTWKSLARPAAPVQTAAVKSWNKTLTSYTVPTAAALQVGPLTMPLRTVTYIEGMDWWQMMLTRFSGLGGMLGNEPFVEHTVILDVAGGRFGVVQK
ncbi:hypothetical protein [Hymenobacter sp. YC55]|uniref:hypothetical protein n=1 Tax=Hymenobacter sp. YC55 TaxID=3034019 RepID=UPI0023F707E9|nr:hypothetical protein [Hymenobacter sp. YC55]MDF7811358.1 hypothetical protein [Hymenobacter sp. YC55]